MKLIKNTLCWFKLLVHSSQIPICNERAAQIARNEDLITVYNKKAIINVSCSCTPQTYLKKIYLPFFLS